MRAFLWLLRCFWTSFCTSVFLFLLDDNTSQTNSSFLRGHSSRTQLSRLRQRRQQSIWKFNLFILFHHLFIFYLNDAGNSYLWVKKKKDYYNQYYFSVCRFHTALRRTSYLFAFFTIAFFFLVPTELSVLKKENFNNWYTLRTYYSAFVVTSTPIQVSRA